MRLKTVFNNEHKLNSSFNYYNKLSNCETFVYNLFVERIEHSRQSIINKSMNLSSIRSL